MKRISSVFSRKPDGMEVGDFVMAAGNGNNIAVKEFLKKYGAAIIDQKAFNGYPALSMAVMNKKIGTVALLLERHADIEVRDKEGMTPLIWAVSGGDKDMILLLLSKGASTLAESQTGLSVWSFVHGGHPEIEVLFIDWIHQGEQRLQSERDVITKNIMGGLQKSIPYKSPPQLKLPGKNS